VGPLLRGTMASTPPFFYVASSQHVTSVTGACVGNFTGISGTDLLLAKATHLEVLAVTTDGLQPVYDVPLNGRIAAMKLVRMAVSTARSVERDLAKIHRCEVCLPYLPPLKGGARDTLLLTTERYDIVALSFDPATRQLKTVARGDLRDRIGRPVERQILAVDPSAKCAVMTLYEGMLKASALRRGAGAPLSGVWTPSLRLLPSLSLPCPQILNMDGGFKEKAYSVRLEEQDVIDAVFLVQVRVKGRSV
jgi:hypothetical protein